MKKSFVLAAVAATLAAPAFAQSSVTIYGRLNESAEATKAGGVKNNQIVDNQSRIGFTGTEDLGGGMKAMFTIEHGFDASTGKLANAATFWNRESTVGLKTNFGTVRAGYFAASEAYFATADVVSMHNHDTGTSQDALFGFIVTGALKNAVGYSTPTFANTVAHIQIGEAIVDRYGKLSRPTSGAVNFDKNALHLGFGYEGLGRNHSYTGRISYDLGALTLAGYYDGITGGTGVTRKVGRISAMYALGAGEFHVNVGKTDNLLHVASSGATQATIGYNYNLSKRTKIYTFYTKVNNNANAQYSPDAGLVAKKAGDDLSSVAVGIRHNF